jgi:hypothetical protein
MGMERQEADDRGVDARLLVFLGAAYLGLSAWMFSQEAAMRRNGGPGILGFELAGTNGRVDEIFEMWGGDGRDAARRSLLIDYGVLAAYTPMMAGLCRRTAARLRRRRRVGLAGLGPTLAAGQVAAGALDVVENTALLAALTGRRGSLPVLAATAARLKFALLAAGLAYLAAGFLPEP